MKHFPASQIRLVFTEELAAKPDQVMQDLFGFLGVKANFIPGNLHQQYHRDGDRKYPLLTPATWLVSKLEKLLPNQYRGWSLRFDQWNTRPGQKAGLPADVRDRLAAYYKADIARLEQLFHISVPWRELAGSDAAWATDRIPPSLRHIQREPSFRDDRPKTTQCTTAMETTPDQ